MGTIDRENDTPVYPTWGRFAIVTMSNADRQRLLHRKAVTVSFGNPDNPTQYSGFLRVHGNEIDFVTFLDPQDTAEQYEQIQERVRIVSPLYNNGYSHRFLNLTLKEN